MSGGVSESSIIIMYRPRDFTSEGDLIVDFCMRHGITSVAAKLEGRKFIGVEKEEEAYNRAVSRYSELFPMMESPTKSETKVRRFIRTQYYADAMKEAQSAWNDGVAQDTVKQRVSLSGPRKRTVKKTKSLTKTRTRAKRTTMTKPEIR